MSRQNFEIANNNSPPRGYVHISEVLVFLFGLDFSDMPESELTPIAEINGRVIDNPPIHKTSQDTIMGALLDGEAMKVIEGVSHYIECLERPLPDHVEQDGITHAFPDSVKEQALTHGEELGDELGYAIHAVIYEAIESQIGTIPVNDDVIALAKNLNLANDGGLQLNQEEKGAVIVMAAYLFQNYVGHVANALGREWFTIRMDSTLDQKMAGVAHDLLTQCGLILPSDGVSAADLKM